ncbi:hypothetical protein SK128_025890, partial [Halocaridina rubra]
MDNSRIRDSIEGFVEGITGDRSLRIKRDVFQTSPPDVQAISTETYDDLAQHKTDKEEVVAKSKAKIQALENIKDSLQNLANAIDTLSGRHERSLIGFSSGQFDTATGMLTISPYCGLNTQNQIQGEPSFVLLWIFADFDRLIVSGTIEDLECLAFLTEDITLALENGLFMINPSDIKSLEEAVSSSLENAAEESAQIQAEIDALIVELSTTSIKETITTSTLRMQSDAESYRQFLESKKYTLLKIISSIKVKVGILKRIQELLDRVKLFLNHMSDTKGHRIKRSIPEFGLEFDLNGTMTISPYCGLNSADKLEGPTDYVIIELLDNFNDTLEFGSLEVLQCMVWLVENLTVALENGSVFANGNSSENITSSADTVNDTATILIYGLQEDVGNMAAEIANITAYLLSLNSTDTSSSQPITTTGQETFISSSTTI